MKIPASLVLIVLSAPVFPQSVAEPVADPSLREAVTRLRALRDPEHPPVAELAPPFAAVTRAQVGFLLDVLESGVVPDLGEGRQILSGVQRELVLAALTTHGRAAVQAQVGERLAEAVTPAQRRAAIHVWGAVGTPLDLERVFGLAVSAGESGLQRATSEPLRQAVASIVARSPEAHVTLTDRWSSLSNGVLQAVLLALGDLGDPAALDLFAGVLLWRPSLNDLALAQIRKVGPSFDSALNEEVLLQLRPHVLTAEPEKARSVCLALAALDDLEAVPQLIELLSGDSQMLRETALWCLRDLTGLAFASDARRWRHWLESERAWLRERMPSELRRLSPDDPGSVRAALAELRRHPLARSEVASALGRLLRNGSPDVRLLACDAALEVGDRGVVDHLVELFEDASPLVVDAAWRAAKALTRIDLPPDVRTWTSELDRRRG